LIQGRIFAGIGFAMGHSISKDQSNAYSRLPGFDSVPSQQANSEAMRCAPRLAGRGFTWRWSRL